MWVMTIRELLGSVPSASTVQIEPSRCPEGLFCELTPIVQMGTVSCDRCAVTALGVVFQVDRLRMRLT